MLFSSFWRSKNIVNEIKINKIDIYHGLSHELPIGIEKTNVKTVVTIHDLIYLRYPELFTKVDRKIFDIRCHMFHLLPRLLEFSFCFFKSE